MGAGLDVDAVVRDWAERGSQLDEPSRRAVVAILDNELNRPGDPSRSWTDALYAFNPTLVVSVDDGRVLRSIVRSHLAFDRPPAQAAALHDRIGVLIDDLVVGAARRRVVEPPVVVAARPKPRSAPRPKVAPPTRSVLEGPRRTRPLRRLPGVLAALAGIALLAAIAPLTPIMSNSGKHKAPVAALPFGETTTTTSGRSSGPVPVPRTTTTTTAAETGGDSLVTTGRPGTPRTSLPGATVSTTPPTLPVIPSGGVPGSPPITSPPPASTTTTTTTPIPIFVPGPINNPIGPVVGPVVEPATPTTTTTTTTTTTRPTPTTTTPPVASAGSRPSCPHGDDPPPGWDNDSGRHSRPGNSCGRPLGTGSVAHRTHPVPHRHGRLV